MGTASTYRPGNRRQLKLGMKAGAGAGDHKTKRPAIPLAAGRHHGREHSAVGRLRERRRMNVPMPRRVGYRLVKEMVDPLMVARVHLGWADDSSAGSLRAGQRVERRAEGWSHGKHE